MSSGSVQHIPLTPLDDGLPLPSEQARYHLLSSRPRSPHLHRWQDGAQARLLVVNGSRLFDLTPELAARIDAAVARVTEAELLSQLGIDGAALIDDAVPAPMPVHAFSLAVAQRCNLGCTYCYAQQGDFGGEARNMPVETALLAVDQLLGQTPEGGKFNLAFMGGEPLVNRRVLRAATEHAVEQAAARGLKPTFSITTNGTLLTAEDADFFEQHGFAVTISLDGVGDTHDQLRPFKGGKGSFERIMRNLQPLLRRQQRMQVSARVTVTPHNLRLQPMLEQFLQAGFYTVGFSPMLSSPNGQAEMGGRELDVLLDEMIACGEVFEAHARRGERYGFANLLNALREIGKGTHRPYPCGAGAGYLGVSASGNLYACHRFVDDDAGAMGDLSHGVDQTRQSQWLAERHVHQQSPCRQCWARYQCGGGCHHEVIGRGRAACDYVRGWLQYCMGVYGRLGALAAH
ncbi:MAG: radical SAM protein [Gammaproteobacteria bacterium]|nr:radical SAM protein [Gammaproteobacteria bacterium]